jgi:hypothetical protein
VKKCIDALNVSGRRKTYPCTESVGYLDNDNGSKNGTQVIVRQIMRSEQSQDCRSVLTWLVAEKFRLTVIPSTAVMSHD